MKESFYQKILDHRQWIWKAICIVILYMLFINPLILGADISKSDFKEINTVAIENALKRDYSQLDGSHLDGKYAYFDASWEGFSHPNDIKNNKIIVRVFVEDQPEKTSGKIQLGRQFFFYDGYIHKQPCFDQKRCANLCRRGNENGAFQTSPTSHNRRAYGVGSV